MPPPKKPEPAIAPPSATPRAPLTRETILATAEAFADRGLESLTMRKLAEALGVEAMSLYNHVANKDDLFDGMVDRVIAEIELPGPGADWRAAMRQRALSAHAMLLRHPWASMLIVSRFNTGPAMLRYMDATLACLHGAGFSYALADHAMNAMDSHIYGFTLLKANFPLLEEEYASAAAHFLPLLNPATHPALRGLVLEIVDGRHSGINHFEFGLDLLLDGLARLVARPG